MNPASSAKCDPERPACIMASTGEVTTFRQLYDRSNQGAQAFRALGLETGDTIALLLDNNPRFLEIAWAAHRSGLYYVCISTQLTAPEIEYIVRDSGARALLAAPAVGPAVVGLAAVFPDLIRLSVNGALDGFDSFEDLRGGMPARPIADETAGSDMLYSSGTTGRPKGIKPPLSGESPDAPHPRDAITRDLMRFGEGPDCIYLSPAPLYHSAPLRWAMTVHRNGGAVVIMEKFDPEAVLALVERHRITCGQFVPTHFVRLLRLPPEVRSRYDLRSLRAVMHGAAPCPVPVKEQMIAWWGPILHEYYAGTESNGLCLISSEDWLTHKGSVGRAIIATVQICDETGEPLPARTEGLVYFAGGRPLCYHNAPEKNAHGTNRHGWSTLGDVGWVDEDGFLYLTDRKDFMIISGGVNIYPQEVEDVLITHPRVADAAVVGAPHAEMGEQVVAVIQPADWADATDAFRQELTEWCRTKISPVKAPRRIDFMPDLPRHATGKLYKRLIRDAYWGKTNPRIV